MTAWCAYESCLYWNDLPGLLWVSVAESWPLMVLLVPTAWMIGVRPLRLRSFEPRARRLIIVLLAALVIDACTVWGAMLMARYGTLAAYYLGGAQ